MKNDLEYLKNYKPNTLYVNKNDNGKYLTLVNEKGVDVGEMEVSKQIKLALQAFYVDEKKDIRHFKLIKFRNNKSQQELSLSNFGLSKIIEFCNLIQSIDLNIIDEDRISFDQKIDLSKLGRLLSGADINKLLQEMSKSNVNFEDMYAIARKKCQLEKFAQMLSDASLEEADWQKFFEQNAWIFGHGLNYIFLAKINNKLENVTTGHDYQTPGKRVDALMKTKAILSQYVLIEIKRPEVSLLNETAHRSGCYSPSKELVEAVSQIQKTTFDFTRKNQAIKDQIKDEHGNFLQEEIYRINPKSYLIIGSLEELRGNDDKFTCFQVYRDSLKFPEIITYDELYERAQCIVANISNVAA